MFDDFDTQVQCEEVYDEHWMEGFTEEEWKEIMEG